MKKIIFLMTILLSTLASAEESSYAVGCQVHLVDRVGRLIRAFQSDRYTSCQQTMQDCRHYAARVARRYPGARCEVVRNRPPRPVPPRPRPPRPVPPRPRPTPPPRYDVIIDIQNRLNSPDVVQRSIALDMLRDVRDPRALELSVLTTGDNDYNVRIKASNVTTHLLQVLEVNYPEYTNFLLGSMDNLYLTNSHHDVKLHSIKVLKVLNTAQTLTTLLRAVGDQNYSVRTLAHNALNEKLVLPDLVSYVQTNFEMIKNLTTNSSSEIRLESVKVLGNTFLPRALLVLVQSAGDDNYNVRVLSSNKVDQAINQGVATRLNERQIQRLSELYQVGTVDVRLNAVKVAGSNRSPLANELLYTALRDTNYNVRTLAERLLRR